MTTKDIEIERETEQGMTEEVAVGTRIQVKGELEMLVTGSMKHQDQNWADQMIHHTQD